MRQRFKISILSFVFIVGGMNSGNGQGLTVISPEDAGVSPLKLKQITSCAEQLIDAKESDSFRGSSCSKSAGSSAVTGKTAAIETTTLETSSRSGILTVVTTTSPSAMSI
jgi:hypothetical protein